MKDKQPGIHSFLREVGNSGRLDMRKLQFPGGILGRYVSQRDCLILCPPCIESATR